MDTLKLAGPYAFIGAPNIDHIASGISGVYIRCITTPDGAYRAHYVCEALDVKQRQIDHRAKQLRGEYDAFSPDDLRKNVTVLVHCANEGMVSRFVHIAREEFNRRYLQSLCVFYADLRTLADKNVRWTYESALIRAIRDYGQNVLHVGHVRWVSPSSRTQFKLDTGSARVEALSGVILNFSGLSSR